jgi:hypothetical protein
MDHSFFCLLLRRDFSQVRSAASASLDAVNVFRGHDLYHCDDVFYLPFFINRSAIWRDNSHLVAYPIRRLDEEVVPAAFDFVLAIRGICHRILAGIVIIDMVMILGWPAPKGYRDDVTLAIPCRGKAESSRVFLPDKIGYSDPAFGIRGSNPFGEAMVRTFAKAIPGAFLRFGIPLFGI